MLQDGPSSRPSFEVLLQSLRAIQRATPTDVLQSEPTESLFREWPLHIEAEK